MKSYLFLFLAFVTSSMAYAQKELQIEYNVVNCETRTYTEKIAILRANQSSTLYVEKEMAIVSERPGEDGLTEMVVNQAYKNLAKNVMWSLEDRRQVVEEKMDSFQWEFTQDTDTILNYICRKATSEFRGRKYEAWFTTELHFRAAPWKVHGLPGVVLKLQIDKDYYVLEAKHLSITDSEEEIKTPFKHIHYSNWKEYLKGYAELQKERVKNTKALEIKYGRKYEFYYPKLEIIIEKNNISFEEMAKKMGLR
jgi:GLPGLI family protein